MIVKMENSDDFPTEIQNQFVTFHENLEKIDDVLQGLSQLDFENEQLTSLEKARLHLTSAYTMNSLYWMYLICKGENLDGHPIKSEMDRIKMKLLKAKEIEDKKKAPKIDMDTAKRFVKSSLWEPNDKAKQEESVKKEIQNLEIKENCI